MNLDLRNSHTQPYKCKIYSKPCKGRVSVNEDKDVFLCQNEKDGEEANNKLGYKYSWIVQYGDYEQTDFKLNEVTDFEFITEEELNADTSLDGKDIEVKIDGVNYIAVLKLKS